MKIKNHSLAAIIIQELIIYYNNYRMYWCGMQVVLSACGGEIDTSRTYNNLGTFFSY